MSAVDVAQVRRQVALAARLAAKAGERSSLASVRNPVLALPATAALLALPADARAALAAVLVDLAADAQVRADVSWRKHKAPMAAYWKACAVYARHIARAVRP